MEEEEEKGLDEEEKLDRGSGTGYLKKTGKPYKGKKKKKKIGKRGQSFFIGEDQLP